MGQIARLDRLVHVDFRRLGDLVQLLAGALARFGFIGRQTLQRGAGGAGPVFRRDHQVESEAVGLALLLPVPQVGRDDPFADLAGNGGE